MASQSSQEAWAALLAPSTDREPTAGDPHDYSLVPNVDSREALEKQGDQPKSPDPGSQVYLTPQGPNPEMVNKEDNNTILGLSFPRKLWMIMEDAAFTSVHCSDKGDTVVIEANLFQTAVLQLRGADQIFKTDSIKSFIREMNLYGFSKICPSRCSAGKKKLMIYRNFNFQRDKLLLLQNIRRKARWGRGNHLPSEQGGPSDEGMSSNATSVPLATAGREGAGELTNSPPEYPSYNLVMAVYKTFYSTMMAALSVMAPDEASEAEE
ncbi:heat shock transcription factor, X-linked member 3-like [Cervus elaphus]|uniref:heat shock transcription factor, X-linked member 3-like n=1 Tax=Cervus elaphus TaxID=9860 RepID=UPI001CC33050|nr:heat shock transcription factor, X-linked member 3-like [Cervus elaphus]